MTNTIIWAGPIAGAAIGLYVLLQFYLSGKALGCSSAYGHVCGLFSRLPLFTKDQEFGAFNHWRIWFTAGLPVGGAIAVFTSPDAHWLASTSMGIYDQILPHILWLKIALVFTGGTLIGVGARIAGGCTSGHTMVGVALLNMPSIIVSLLFFAGGLATVQILFRLAGAV